MIEKIDTVLKNDAAFYFFVEYFMIKVLINFMIQNQENGLKNKQVSPDVSRFINKQHFCITRFFIVQELLKIKCFLEEIVFLLSFVF